MKRLVLMISIAAVGCAIGTAHAEVNIAPRPLSMSVGQPPNILLVLDNSNTMAEGLDGLVAAECEPGANPPCVAGAASPLSKSEMIREVGRGLLDTYRGEINLGLMAYQQFSMGSQWGDVFDDQVWLGYIGNRLYDVSYDPSSFVPSFPGHPWDDSRKAFRTSNPADSGNSIHYNIGIPGYGPNPTDTYCTTRDPGGGYRDEPFRFQCYEVKEGTNDSLPASATNNQCNNQNYAQTDNYSGIDRCTQGWLSDSARARGVTHWGQRMTWLSFNQQEWVQLSSPGLGYLHTPIRHLDDDHAAALALKLAPQHHDTSNTNLFTDPSEPVIVAGLTPLEGTLLTARDYITGQSGYFGADQGSGNADESLPESCDVNAAIWLTDGMPSIGRDGGTYGADVAAALADAVSATESLHQAGMDVYVVGFSMPPNVPEDALDQLAAAGGTELPFLANDPAGLFAAVNDIFQQIIADAQAEFGNIDSGAVLRSGDWGFRTVADPSDWTGDVYGVRNPDGNEQIVWRASEQLPQQRNLLTRGGAFNSNHSELLAAVHNDEDRARDIVAYIRGNTSLEQQNGGMFQNRSRQIGAVVGSQPVLQRPVNHAWDRLPPNSPGGDSYNAHVQAKFNRPDVIYVGSNSGVLHALDARTGQELFGYVPMGVWSRLANVASPVPDFTYTVDGSVVVTDAYLPSRGGWRTVLLGSLGAGGQSVFAIDVTNPDQVDASSVLWEVSAEDLDGSNAGDLGYTFATPRVARLENGQFVAVVANGYGSANNDARLLVFNLANGNLMANLLAATGTTEQPNGLSTPRVARERPHEFYDRWVYAGDLHGDLWRFDLNNLGGSGQRIFNGDRPITAAPQTSYPRGGQGYNVSFGTGKFFEVGDNNLHGAPDEYFYLIYDRDPDGGATNFTRAQLLNRSFAGGSTAEFEDIDFTTSHGFFVNMGAGDRLLFQPRVLAGMLLFSSFRPSADVCTVGGYNTAYLLDLRTGEGAFDSGRLGRITGIEGAPSRPGFTVQAREQVDPDTGDTIPTEEIIVRVGSEEIIVEGGRRPDLATDLAEGRRSNWLQLR
jgi:type IV pilus assembly protein PilY1